jgi:hypothetical protein
MGCRAAVGGGKSALSTTRTVIRKFLLEGM